MKLVILDRNAAFLEEAKDVFSGISTPSGWEVSYYSGDVCNHPIANTAFVSPANSLGFMDGGIDAAYMKKFYEVQKAVRSGIRELGMKTGLGRPYLPVGSAISVEVEKTTLLISAPTMFLPHSVEGTRNAYYAFMAALCMFEKAAKSLSWPLETMVCPALCTGYGRMPPSVAATQMRDALVDFLAGFRPEERCHKDITWCYIGPLHDHEQPKIFDNREIQEGVSPFGGTTTKALVEACRKLDGLTLDFELDPTSKGVFKIGQAYLACLDSMAPQEYGGQIWHIVASIPWGQGFHTCLFYNGMGRLIAVNDMSLNKKSKIVKEYSCPI